MRKHSTIQAIYMSFFSKSLYKDVGANWRGVSFIYFFLLMALMWIPLAFKLQSGLNNFMADEAPKFIRQIPKITISKGEAKVDAEMPYFIKDTNGKPLMAIDTTGRINALEEAGAMALLTKDKFIIKKSNVETRTFELSQIEELTIDQSSLYNMADAIRQWAIIFLYPFILAFSYGYRIILALLYALIGLLFARGLKVDLKYKAVISLAIISMTPAIIINTIYNYLELRIPYWFFISFVISMSYLYFGIKANLQDGTAAPVNEEAGK